MRARGVACACALALAYVAALFATTDARDDRDAPRVMKRRFASLSVVCALAWAPALAASDDAMSLDAWRRTLGLAPPEGQARAVAHGMSVALAATLGETAARARDGRRDGRRTTRTTLMAIRDYAHAPLCEEWCFRACALAALMRSGASAASASALSSALFARGARASLFRRARRGRRRSNGASRVGDAVRVHVRLRARGVSRLLAPRVVIRGDGVSLRVQLRRRAVRARVSRRARRRRVRVRRVLSLSFVSLRVSAARRVVFARRRASSSVVERVAGVVAS